jgi:small subunit ribosomal protein S10
MATTQKKTTTATATKAAATKTTSKPKVALKSTNNIVVKLLSCDYELLDSAVRIIIETAKRTGAIVRGPIPLPTKIEKIDLLRSPHVNSTSREQLEMRTHKRLMTIEDPSNGTMLGLQKLELPAGVYVEIEAAA